MLALIASLVQMWASVVMPFEHLWIDFVAPKGCSLVENIGNDPLYIKDPPFILTLYTFRGLIPFNGDDDKSLYIRIPIKATRMECLGEQ